MAASSTTLLLECEKLFGAEALVVDLRRGFNEVLEVCSREEVAEVHEFAVVFILNYSSMLAEAYN
jgi:hypothetical protein